MMTHDRHNIDNEVQEAMRTAHVDLHERLAASRARVSNELAGAASRNRPGTRARRRIIVATIGTAFAFAVIAASLPLFDLTSDSNVPARIPGLPESASAAEALSYAGEVVFSDGADVGGLGRFWLTTSETWHEGHIVSVNEQWYDPKSGEYTLAAHGVDRGAEPERPAREVLLMDVVDETDTQRIRTFERPLEAKSWRRVRGYGPGGAGPHETFDVGSGDGDRQRAFGTAVMAWMREAAPSHDREQIAQATTTFVRTTLPDHFTTNPDMPAEAFQAGGGGQITISREAIEQVQTTARLRQVIYLLTTTRPSPEATQYLYERVGDFKELERLSDVTIDGRRAMRIRFDLTDEEITPERQRVLVIDATTGLVIRTETIDRSAWTTISRPQRVERIGDGSEICLRAHKLPCATLRLDGELAQEANAAAATWRASIAYRRTFGGSAGKINAFMLGIGIAPTQDSNGVTSSPGGCSRSWNWLTICRG